MLLWGRSLRLGSQKLWLDVHRFKLYWHTVTCQGRACGNQSCHQTKGRSQSRLWNVTDTSTVHPKNSTINLDFSDFTSVVISTGLPYRRPHAWWIRLWPSELEIIHRSFHFSVSSLQEFQGHKSSSHRDESLVKTSASTWLRRTIAADYCSNHGSHCQSTPTALCADLRNKQFLPGRLRTLQLRCMWPLTSWHDRLLVKDGERWKHIKLKCILVYTTPFPVPVLIRPVCIWILILLGCVQK